MNVSDTVFTSKHILLFDLPTIRAILVQSDTNFATAFNNKTYDLSAVADSANNISVYGSAFHD